MRLGSDLGRFRLVLGDAREAFSLIFYWFSYEFQDNDVFESKSDPGAIRTEKRSQSDPQRVPKAVPIDQKSTSKNSQKIIEKNKCEGKLIEVRVVTKERACPKKMAQNGRGRRQRRASQRGFRVFFLTWKVENQTLTLVFHTAHAPDGERPDLHGLRPHAAGP